MKKKTNNDNLFTFTLAICSLEEKIKEIFKYSKFKNSNEKISKKSKLLDNKKSTKETLLIFPKNK